MSRPDGVILGKGLARLLDVREPRGRDALVERIKAAMCRADGPAPDRSHYDAMAREIAAEIERIR